MKTKLITTCALLSVFFCFQHCQNRNLEPQKLLRSSLNFSSAPEDCYIPFHELEDEADNIYQIKESCATEFIGRYETYIDSLNNQLASGGHPIYQNSSTKLIRGVWVDIDELKRVLLDAEFNGPASNPQLYIMQGILPKGDGVDSTEFIFSLQKDSITDNNDTIVTWNYFDFTRPCPAFCPTFTVVE